MEDIYLIRTRCVNDDNTVIDTLTDFDQVRSKVAYYLIKKELMYLRIYRINPRTVEITRLNPVIIGHSLELKESE